MHISYTKQAANAVRYAAKKAKEMKHPYIGTEHLLLGLREEFSGVAGQVLAQNGVETEKIMQLMDELIAPREEMPASQKPKESPRLRYILANSEKEAHRLRTAEVGTEHLLLSMIRDVDCVAARILITLNISLQKLLKDILNASGVDPKDYQDELQDESRGSGSVIEQYCTDMTARAEEGKQDPVVGREEEMYRLMQVLSRRTKNNPVLIGEPGVGKTAIAEGLARRIVNGDVPESMRNKRIVSLNIGSMLAGAKYRGEFEERLKSFLKEVTDSNGEIILFIDELHTIVGAGASEGAVDASNLLKPALARGELRTIGATTLDEYRKYIEKDAALERRFQPVMVSEPTVEDTISILRGLKERFEIHHGVRITDGALIACATLSDRYITDRFLPDKAIDLMDEAASKIRMEIDSMPAELDEISRKIMQLEIEKQALTKEEDSGSKNRLSHIEQELSELKAKNDAMRAQWATEKQSIAGIKRIKQEIEDTKHQMEEAERQYDLEKMAQLKFGTLPALEKQLEDERQRVEAGKDQHLLKEEVTEEEIAEVVSKWTGVPVSRLVESEKEKLLKLPEILHRRVIGQDEAVTAVSEAILRGRAGLKDENRPIGSFIFLGPTGVGKTELAKTLAQALFDDERNMIRIDMSEYMEKHAVSRLVGAPPGYVGYDEGGQLTEAVRRKPYSVILFDEIEKAHPDVFNILLQLLDDGRLTDNQGRTVDFKNTIVIMTSNIGAQILIDGMDDDGKLAEGAVEEVMGLMRTKFRPEFLNRVDEMICFKPLTLKDIRQIVRLILRQLELRLHDRNISLELTDGALDVCAKNGYDPIYGARPLKRYVQKALETRIARAIIAGDIRDGGTIHVVEKDGAIDMRFENHKTD